MQGGLKPLQTRLPLPSTLKTGPVCTSGFRVDFHVLKLLVCLSLPAAQTSPSGLGRWEAQSSAGVPRPEAPPAPLSLSLSLSLALSLSLSLFSPSLCASLSLSFSLLFSLSLSLSLFSPSL